MEKDKKEPEVEYYTSRRDMDYPKGRIEPWRYTEPYYYTERPMDFLLETHVRAAVLCSAACIWKLMVKIKIGRIRKIYARTFWGYYGND